jgi:putative ABC transport system permease protein
MKFLISLAFKNLTRYKRRTLITAMAIAFGMSLFILMESMLIGLEKESERNLFWYETSMARIQHTNYQEENKLLPLIYPVTKSKAIIAHLGKDNIKATARIDFKGEALVYQDPYREDGSLPIHVIGIDLKNDENVYRIKSTIIEGQGRFLIPGDQGIIIGSKLAKNLGAKVGYPLLIRTRTKDGIIQTIDTEIVGIFKTANAPLNMSALFMTLEMANEYLEMDGDVTSISLKISESKDIEKEAKHILTSLKKALGEKVSELDVVSWKILAADFVAIAAAKKGSSSIIILLIMIIALVGISNTMLMATYERIQELSMMRALGMKDSNIIVAFLIEAAGIGIIGSIAAIIFAVGVNYPFVEYGWNFGSLYPFDITEMDVGYRTSGTIEGVWKMSSYIIVLLVGIILPIIVALWPAYKSTKMKIVDGIRDGGTK